MAIFRPFKAFRPKPELAQEVAAKPYDVLNSEEARVEVQGHPLSFLHVGKPEVDLNPSVDLHSEEVYLKGQSNLQNLINQEALVEDDGEFMYVYAQTMNGHTQFGLVGCASVEDYWNDVIKKHEFTRKDKEEDRCNHIRYTKSHSGPIFLTYNDIKEVDDIVLKVTANAPDNDFVALDGIRHTSWVIREVATIERIYKIMQGVKNFYVADGHHRSAAASIVGRERAKANPNHKGDEEYNFFLAVLFPASQLRIMDYNRLVKDFNGNTQEEFLKKVSEKFTFENKGKEIYKPTQKNEFGM